MDRVDPHPPTAGFARASARQLASELAAGLLTSVELTSGLLDRIAAIDAPTSALSLRSVLAVSADALDQAALADQRRIGGTQLSPIDGLAVLVKDNIEAIGLPSSAGSTALLGRDHGNAELVERLRAAGAIILGATNLSEWANMRSPRSASGWSAVGGLTANPWATDRSAGGSSSGSGAALAAGLAPFAIGTETDGSIICPSALNGVVGLKPTVGTVPTRGIVPLSASQDSPGPMARNVGDLAMLYAVLTGQPLVSIDPTTAATLGVASNWRTNHTNTDALFDLVICDLVAAGFRLDHRAVATPTSAEEDDELTVLLAEMVDDLSHYLALRPGEPSSLEAVIDHEVKHRAIELAHFSHEFFIQAVASGGRKTKQYAEARARNLKWAITHCLEPALTGVDVLIAPTYAPAWKQDLILGEDGAKDAPTTMAPAIAGWPIASIPMGLVDGLPVGIGIIGRPGSEATILNVAAAIEATLGLTTNENFAPLFSPARRG